MTCHAGTHIVRELFGDHVALANRSVAALACCACVRVHTMAEVNVSREPVNADPRKRLLLCGRGRQLSDVGTVGFYRLMTAHAETLRRVPHDLTRIRVFVT